MFSGNMKHKGTVFIEYALILAFFLVGGAIFISDQGLVSNISNINGQTDVLLNKAIGEKEAKGISSKLDEVFSEKLLAKDLSNLGKLIVSNKVKELNDYLNANIDSENPINASIINTLPLSTELDANLTQWFYDNSTPGGYNKIVTVATDGSTIYDTSTGKYLAGTHTAVQYIYENHSSGNQQYAVLVAKRNITYTMAKDETKFKGVTYSSITKN